MKIEKGFSFWSWVAVDQCIPRKRIIDYPEVNDLVNCLQHLLFRSNLHSLSAYEFRMSITESLEISLNAKTTVGG